MMEVKTHDSGLPYVEVGGEKRILACLERPADVDTGFPMFALRMEVIDQKDWVEKDLSTFAGTVKDQDGFGSCNAQAAVKACEGTIAFAGQTPIELSALDLYARLCGGVDRGSFVHEALQELKAKGVCLESQFGERNRSIRERDIPKEAVDTRYRFKIGEGYGLKNFTQIGSAIQHNRFVDFGVDIGQRFEPDSRGVIPNRRGSGGGHAMCAVGTTKINGQWYLKVMNSWGRRWGLGGFCFMNESYFVGSFMDAFAVFPSAINDPLDPHEAPDPIA